MIRTQEPFFVMLFWFLKDYLRRWWWAWIIMEGYVDVISRHNRVHIAMIIPALAGAFTVQYDFMGGVARITRQLPISTPRLTTFYWLAGVVLFPICYSILAVLFSVTGDIIPVPRAGALPNTLLLNVIAMGYAGFAMHFMQSLPRIQNNRPIIRPNYFVGLTYSIVVCGIPIFFLYNEALLSENAGTAALLGMFFAATSWFAIRRSLTHYGRQESLSGSPYTSKASRAPRFWNLRCFGLIFPWWRTLQIFMVLVVCGLGVVCADVLLQPQANGSLRFISVFGLWALPYGMAFMPVLEWSTAARSLRTLPYSRARLTLYYLSFPLLGSLLVAILAVGSALIRPEFGFLPRALLSPTLIYLGVVILSLPVLLRFGAKVYSYVLAFSSSFGLMIFHDRDWQSLDNAAFITGVAQAGLFAMVLGGAGLAIAYYLLGNASGCYIRRTGLDRLFE